MKQRILFLVGLAATVFAVYGCNDTTDIPKERLEAGKKFRDAHGAGGSTAPPANTQTGMSKYVGGTATAGQ